ncbi:MAG: class I SAM-dependent methyltransferase [Methanobacteriota archaeon]
MASVEKRTMESYAANPQKEWLRLQKDAFHRLEFDTTMSYLKKYLPKGGLVLDAGCGPGRYSIELAKLGYDVVLFDLTKELLDIARKEIKKERVQKKIKGVHEGSISDLSMFDDESFDAVLCLGGPLGHIEGEKKRMRALGELKRVAKKGAPIFASVIGRLAAIRTMQMYYPVELQKTRNLRSIVETGDDFSWHGGIYCHLFLHEEVVRLFQENGIRHVESVGLEGLAIRGEHGINRYAGDKKTLKNWLWTHERLCTDPAVVGSSEHILVIGKK